MLRYEMALIRVIQYWHSDVSSVIRKMEKAVVSYTRHMFVHSDTLNLKLSPMRTVKS